MLITSVKSLFLMLDSIQAQFWKALIILQVQSTFTFGLNVLYFTNRVKYTISFKTISIKIMLITSIESLYYMLDSIRAQFLKALIILQVQSTFDFGLDAFDCHGILTKTLP